jgi:HSP20 family protein
MGAAPENDLAASIGRLVAPKNSKRVQAAFDVKQTAGETVVLVDLPGVDEDDIRVSEDKGVLSISAPREFNHDLEDAEEYTQLGRPYGAFYCSVLLSPSADAESMTAKYTRGVLKVRVPNKRT